MVNQDFCIFSGDPVLTSLANFTAAKLRSVLGQCIPASLLDAPLKSYQITNFRYSPRQKLVVGLTSDSGRKPIALRVVPRKSLQHRLEKARRIHPDHAFLLDELSAVAWVFPGERKLNLRPLANHSQLSRILQSQRGYRLTRLELVHYVPEHTYTARVHGQRDDGSPVCEYLKIYYDDAGAVTASVMRQIAAQLYDSNIRVPDDVSYFPEQRMLVQSALRRDQSCALSNSAAAAALASFHGLSVKVAGRDIGDPDDVHDATLNLVAKTFPTYSDEIRNASVAIRDALQTTTKSENVLLHGDAHLGNLFSTRDGKVGIIDLDRAHLGAPEEDLASFFAFRLWLAMRDQRNVDTVLNQFPMFLRDYNQRARISVSIRRAYLLLAHKMITERIRRGIARGKISDAGELLEFTRVAMACLATSERYRD